MNNTNVKHHPSHTEQIVSLKRIEGQIRGIQAMVDDGKYCVEILNQLKAVKSALATVERKILQKHLMLCLRTAMTSGSQAEADEKVDELLKLLKR